MQFTIVTFNLNGQARFGWEERCELSGKAVSATGGTLFGFQEFGIGNWQAISPLVPELSLYEGLPAGDIYLNPIAWDRNRFQLVSRGTEWLSEDRQYGRSWEGSERAMSWVELEDHQDSNRHFLHVNVHLDNISELARIRGTERMLELIGTFPQELPAVITGDFNCSPYSPFENAPYTRKPYDMLLEGGFHDSRTEAANAHEDTVPHTYHGYKGQNYAADTFATWHTDWVMLRHLKALRYEIHSEPIDGSFPSDHYPVATTVEYVPPT